jgi:hypothetical protein
MERPIELTPKQNCFFLKECHQAPLISFTARVTFVNEKDNGLAQNVVFSEQPAEIRAKDEELIARGATCKGKAVALATSFKEDRAKYRFMTSKEKLGHSALFVDHAGKDWTERLYSEKNVGAQFKAAMCSAPVQVTVRLNGVTAARGHPNRLSWEIISMGPVGKRKAEEQVDEPSAKRLKTLEETVATQGKLIESMRVQLHALSPKCSAEEIEAKRLAAVTKRAAKKAGWIEDEVAAAEGRIEAKEDHGWTEADLLAAMGEPTAPPVAPPLQHVTT